MATTLTRVFRLPDLGEGLTEAALVQWLVTVGDVIAIDQPIAEVETAKSVVELPSPFAGTVAALHGQEGGTIDVGAPVLEVHTAGDSGATSPEPAADPADETAGKSVEHEAYREEERAGSGNVLIGYGTSQATGRGRRRPRAAPTRPPQASPTSAQASGPAPAPAPALSAASPASVAIRSPLVRRLARDLGLDPRTITPTGQDGSVTRGDVLRAAAGDAARPSPIPEPASLAPAESNADELRVVAHEPLSMLRKAVSATLRRSRTEIPEATVWVDADMTDLWNMRASMAPAGGRAPSITAILARFVLLALEEYPLLAARLTEDGGALLRFDGVNLGVAADTPRGLLVPVIPRADRRTIAELDGDLRALATEARSGTLPPERLRGSTFTLNNYGGFGVDGSAAIINHPEVAILGVGRIMERPWVVDGQIVARRIVQLSLVFDHRVCDGGYAAGFLRRIVDALEQPLVAYGRV